jgi:hypothetical protein
MVFFDPPSLFDSEPIDSGGQAQARANRASAALCK